MSSAGSRNVKRGVNLERRVAKLLGGRRFWVGSGERIDVESPHFLVQTKKVTKMPLAEIVRLAEEMEGWATTDRHDPQGKSWKDKVGMVAVELFRKGVAVESPTIYFMTRGQLTKLFKKMGFDPQLETYDVEIDK